MENLITKVTSSVERQPCTLDPEGSLTSLFLGEYVRLRISPPAQTRLAVPITPDKEHKNITMSAIDCYQRHVRLQARDFLSHLPFCLDWSLH